MSIRIEDCDYEQFLQLRNLNNQSAPAVSAMTEPEWTELWQQAVYKKLAFRNGKLAGFLIGLNESADLKNPTYQWFKKQYDRFIFVDRIVIDPKHRGMGLGRVMYADLHSFAERVAPIIACSVNLNTADNGSLLFHGTYGFGEVSQLQQDEQRLALLIKSLSDHDYIQSVFMQR